MCSDLLFIIRNNKVRIVMKGRFLMPSRSYCGRPIATGLAALAAGALTWTAVAGSVPAQESAATGRPGQ